MGAGTPGTGWRQGSSAELASMRAIPALARQRPAPAPHHRIRPV